MNKKFSTLLAGLALVSSVASATVNSDIKLQVGPNDGLYQIAKGDSVLVIDAAGNFVGFYIVVCEY